MGQYKVPQDVEAEDKILGPLSIRQFIYVIIGLGWGVLMWRLLAFNVVIMIITIVPITGFFLLLGFGRRQEQSFENYFVALVRFVTIPRIRVWDKDLLQEELIKEAIKVPEVIITKNVSRGSLAQLALIMDTHGVQKDPSVQIQDGSNQALAYGQRILEPSQIAPTNPGGLNTIQAMPQDDVLDESNARNKHINSLLENQEVKIHQQALGDIKQNLSTPKATGNTGPNNSQLQTSGAIIKKAMFQSGNLTVSQIAKRAGGNNLPQGESVNINPLTTK